MIENAREITNFNSISNIEGDVRKFGAKNVNHIRNVFELCKVGQLLLTWVLTTARNGNFLLSYDRTKNKWITKVLHEIRPEILLVYAAG
jgi:hypothetical protein